MTESIHRTTDISPFRPYTRRTASLFVSCCFLFPTHSRMGSQRICDGFANEFAADSRECAFSSQRIRKNAQTGSQRVRKSVHMGPRPIRENSQNYSAMLHSTQGMYIVHRSVVCRGGRQHYPAACTGVKANRQQCAACVQCCLLTGQPHPCGRSSPGPRPAALARAAALP